MPAVNAPLAPLYPRTEFLVNPLGLEAAQPRLSWEVNDPRRGAVQSAYRILVASRPELLGQEQGDLWDSGKVPGNQTAHVTYAGPALKSLQAAYWQVRTWDGADQPSPWSETALWEMGLLKEKDWHAQWIGSPQRDNTGPRPAVYLRREFALPAPIRWARLAITALGVYEAWLNGRRVGQDRLTPGWTDYATRVPYQIYDVTGLLREGDNAWGVVIGEGWFSGRMAWKGVRGHYGQEPRLCAQLMIERTDGSRQLVVTDGTWQFSVDGPIRENDIYDGEAIDARIHFDGWAESGFAAAAWAPALVAEAPAIARSAKLAQNVQIVGSVLPQKLTEPTPGCYIFHLGQNMVGWARVRLRGPAGTTVKVRFGEMLCDDGTLYTANLRSARATDYFTLRGTGQDEVFEPRFTFHGFQYAELTGCAAPPSLADVTGIVIHTACPPTGTFACSEPLLNQLQSNILWGQKGNYLEVPTDCPQRNERLGWTGDAQVFCRTAAWNLDVAAFFTKWMRDIRDCQFPDGAVPDVVPDVGCGKGNCAWADAAVICPWTMYLCYGDTRILADNYRCMARWVEFMRTTSTDLIRPESGYGDWLAIDHPQHDCGRAPTPKSLIGTAYFVHCADLMAQVAGILNKPRDVAKYQRLAARVRRAFLREFVTPGGRLVGHTQTGYLLALAFDLLPEAKRPIALAHLVRDLESRKVHLSTGFVGTPLLAPTLTRFGRSDLAYRLVQQQDWPSWLYTVRNGATTMWERWNSYTKEKGFGDVSMNSFNHYAYGSIGEWLYATVAGVDLDPAQPGYRHIVFRPEPGGGLTWAGASLHSLHGPIRSAWQMENQGASFSFTVPPNTTATACLPCPPDQLTEHGQPVAPGEGIVAVRAEQGKAVLTLGAGSYTFHAHHITAIPAPPQ